MQFGLFGSAQAARGGPDVDSSAGFRQFVDYNVEAEALGYHSTFVVEHHFTGFGQISATLNLLTWIGARTSTLRLGTAVMVLPWHNPVLLAEQVATIDLLSGGRMDLGVGKGYRHNEFAGFGIPMEEADARFEEALDVITKAWLNNEPWSHDGQFWKFNDIVVEPPTAQRPHPPFWMGAGSERSIKRVVERGHNLLLDQFASIEQIGERIAFYKAEVEAAGGTFDPMKVGVARAVNVLYSDADRQKAVEARVAAMRRTRRLAQTPTGDNKATLATYDETNEAAEAAALFGTPDQINEKLERLQEMGVRYMLLNVPGGIETLRHFARDVMPAFRD
jgi:alkanesulfonate monooxygenase SsuD/methylene tetrahydromethanopterin reductase-like flavin-dependent oxidoreductase (luciferase family)